MRERVRHIRQAQCRQTHHGRHLNNLGFTLIEMLVALAVGSLVLSGTVVSIQKILVATGQTKNKVVSLTDINRAALSIKNDLMMAQTANLTGSSANLTWTDYTTSFGHTGFTNHSAAYRLSGKQLIRTYDGATSIIGRNVTSLAFTPSGIVTNGAVSVAISTSSTTPPSNIVTLKFSIHMRSQVIQ